MQNRKCKFTRTQSSIEDVAKKRDFFLPEVGLEPKSYFPRSQEVRPMYLVLPKKYLYYLIGPKLMLFVVLL